MIRICFCVVASCLLTSVSLRAQAPSPPTPLEDTTHVYIPLGLNPPAPLRAGQPVNDRTALAYLEAEGRKLVDQGLTLTRWDQLPENRSPVARLKLPGAGSSRQSHAQVADQMARATGVLGTFYLCSKCSKLHVGVASGFFIHKDGAFVTCRHVLTANREGGKGMVVMMRDGRVLPVSDILACDELSDLAVLQVQGRDFPTLPLARRPASPGSPVTVVSHPERRLYAVTTGVVSRHQEETRTGGVYRTLSITAEFGRGSSGAPVCDEYGAVLGIADNTYSIYHSVEGGQQKNLQMVIRNCVDAGSLRRLLGADTPWK